MKQKNQKLSLQKIDSLISLTLKELQIEEPFKAYPLFKNWKKIVGESLSLKTQPEFIRGTTLIVSVENSAWLHQLQLQKKMLLSKITDFKLEVSINDIRFRMKNDS